MSIEAIKSMNGNNNNKERYLSGQRGQTVNLLAFAFGGSNPPLSTIFTVKTIKAYMDQEVNTGYRNQKRGDRTQSQILKSVLKEASQADAGLAIFDLDSTLIDVRHRMLQIFKDFVNLERIKKLFPKAFDVISSTSSLLPSNYFIEDHMKDLNLDGLGDVFIEELLKFWKQSFFNNDYLKHDLPYPGALDFVKKMQDYPIKIVYLTGRDKPRMEEGTYKSLLNLGFPIDDTQLILKPHKSMDDALYKKEVIFEFDKKHQPIWFFENEPFVVNPVFEEAPHINVIFFDSNHSQREKAANCKIPSIKSFLY